MKNRVRTRVRMFAIIVVSLAMMIPLGVATAALSGIAHRWVDILAQFTGPALVAALAGLAASAVLRSGVLAGLGAVVCALVLTAGNAQWNPPRGSAETGSPELTVYSANLHVMNENVHAVAASIAASNADIVMLVEVGGTASEAADLMLAGYPYRVSNQGLHRTDAQAMAIIASRRPLTPISLNVWSLHILSAVAETPLGPVTVSAVHFTRPWPYRIQWEQIRQAENLTAWTSQVEGPLIVAGDFNSVSSAHIGKLVRSGGMIAAPGWPGTWPARLPAFAGITIDQVYRSPDLALLDRKVGRAMGSDHHPVITRFARAERPAD